MPGRDSKLPGGDAARRQGDDALHARSRRSTPRRSQTSAIAQLLIERCSISAGVKDPTAKRLCTRLFCPELVE